MQELILMRLIGFMLRNSGVQALFALLLK